jgi:hypothetical protein
MSTSTARRVRRALGAAAVVLVAGGCGLVPTTSGDDSTAGSFATPTEQAPQEFTPLTEPPRDTREVVFGGYSLWSPAAFQQSERQGPEGVQMVVLGKPANRSGGVCEVVAFVETDPQSSAEEQMYGLAGSKEVAGASEISRESLQWPGAQSAVLVRWTERTSGPQGEITQRFAQLAVQPSDDVIVSVVAVAPQEEFDESGVVEVLRTLTVDA